MLFLSHTTFMLLTQRVLVKSIVHLTTTVDAKSHTPGEYRLADVSGTTMGGKPLRAQLPNIPVVLRIEGK
jgi:hypothetical protein